MLRNVWKLTVPTLLSRILAQGSFFGLMFASRFNDTNELAGIALAMSIINILFLVLMGAVQPLETLTAHAYGGGNTKLCCKYLY